MAPDKKGRSRRSTRAHITSDGSPTEEEFSKLRQWKTFCLEDDDHVKYKFHVQSTATILPHNVEPGVELPECKYWVAKILDIRAIEHEDDTNDIWVKVQWYYSPKEVKDVIKSNFDPSLCSPYERFPSEHRDIVHVEAFNDVVTVHTLTDSDPDQPPIPSDTFFTRCSSAWLARRLNPLHALPKCICGSPYDTEDLKPSMVQHFCPRPSCRKWYHQSCLLSKSSREGSKRSQSSSPSKASSTQQSSVISASGSISTTSTLKSGRSKGLTPHALFLLSTSPFADDQRHLTALLNFSPSPEDSESADETRLSPPAEEVAGPPTKRRRISRFENLSVTRLSKASMTTNGVHAEHDSTKTDQSSVLSPEAGYKINEALSALPAGLVKLASQPIVRGAACAGIADGVSGNVRAVVRARELVEGFLRTWKGGSASSGEMSGKAGSVGEGRSGGSVDAPRASGLEGTEGTRGKGEKKERSDSLVQEYGSVEASSESGEGNMLGLTGLDDVRRMGTPIRYVDYYSRYEKPAESEDRDDDERSDDEEGERMEIALDEDAHSDHDMDTEAGEVEELLISSDSSRIENWEETVFGKDCEVKDFAVKVKGRKSALPNVLCPGCGSAI